MKRGKPEPPDSLPVSTTLCSSPSLRLFLTFLTFTVRTNVWETIRVYDAGPRLRQSNALWWWQERSQVFWLCLCRCYYIIVVVFVVSVSVPVFMLLCVYDKGNVMPSNQTSPVRAEWAFFIIFTASLLAILTFIFFDTLLSQVGHVIGS